MRINSPEVTLADEARNSVAEEVRSGFLDWLFEFNVTGDNGELYGIGGSILSMNQEKIDLTTMNLCRGKGGVRQLKNSIYKVAEYPGSLMHKFFRNPQGTLQIDKHEHSVLVTCGSEFSVECFDNHEWHFQLDSGDGEYKADLWHRPYGCPLWYGREAPSYLTQHSITYGYNWAGDVDGVFTFRGKTVRVKGTGQRERYIAVDSSAAELGGWEDWGFITFNEIHSSMYEMRLGMKDFSVYDLENSKYYPEGEMIIEHEDWAFMRELDGFIPTCYHIRISVKDGIYEACAHVANARTWGVTYKVPDNPVATLIFDRVEGTFTCKDGTVRTLTGGRGSMSVRQWHAYPNILPRELYSDEEQEADTESKFDTL
ncbi:MAG: hypothetical protein LUC87_07070 [Clostridiales bacterium]|nr:hypothetical protein [Clostridiales bacterium]